MILLRDRVSARFERVIGITFPGSRTYWDRRYAFGGYSGAGSSGRLAAFKAETLNRFVEQHGIGSVVELGCGDGNQLSLGAYPFYLGIDVSREAVRRCLSRLLTILPNVSLEGFPRRTGWKVLNFICRWMSFIIL